MATIKYFRMRHLFSILFTLLCSHFLFGQKETVVEKGTVSYVSSQNVYVKFSSTEHIQQGDTLFIDKDSKLTPALLVKDKSSTSCVCSYLMTDKAKVGDAFFSKSMVEKKPEKTKTETPKDTTIHPKPVVIVPEEKEDDTPAVKQKIKGRISAASYSNFYGGEETHRMRYTLTFQGNNIKKSRFSTENFISFRHTIGEWSKVRDHLEDALKVYSLSVKYDFDKTSSITLGRKINYRISSMGAIDGLQFEKGVGQFIFGAIGGWRPDFADYGFNSDLLQAGAYVSHRSANKSEETTLAFVEQRNKSNTDRRFVYFQHSNALSTHLNLFVSFETDLYQNVNNEITHNPSLTNLLLSIRYKVSKRLNLSLAYDNRKNIIYYESYKNYIDQLIEDETRQGLRVGGSYRFSKWINWGVNASLRFQKSGANESKNINSYLNFSRLPGINAMASLSANLLQTSYLDSKLFGAQISKDIIRNKLQGEVYYRLADYQYKNYEYKVRQHIGGLNFSWYISRNLGFYLYYEGTFDQKSIAFNRFNTKIIQRF